MTAINDWATPEIRFLFALGLGFLLGLEREISHIKKKGKAHLGVRTYTLISLLGFGCAWLQQDGAPWIVPAGLAAVGLIVFLEYGVKSREGHVGLTSESAAFVAYAVGALCLLSEPWFPVALGVTTAILLSEKSEVERLIEHLEYRELGAILRFLVVAAVIFPVLPDRTFTRFAINPASLWKIVILVASVGFAGYVLTRRYGSRMGLWLSGLVGGIVSSTAVCVAMGRRAGEQPSESRECLQASILASSVMYPRILVLIALVNPLVARLLAWRVLPICALGFVLAATIKHARADAPMTASTSPSADADQPAASQDNSPLRNPFEIRPALVFAGLFMGLTVLTRLVRDYLGGAGFLGLAAIVGVADVDPFVLSLAAEKAADPSLIVRAMVLAMMSNTLAKGVYFGYPAAPMRRETAWRFGLWAALHIPFVLV